MTNAQHTVESDGYEYVVYPLTGNTGISTGQAMFYAHFTQAFETAQKEWEEMVANDSSLKFYHESYLYSMVLGMDGMPVALVMNVDDIVQAFPFTSMEKIEEDLK